MSKKIEISNENQRYARELRNIQKHHKEGLDQIQSKHSKSLDEVRKLNQKDLVEIRSLSNKDIVEEVQRRDERINEIKKNYNDTSSKLDNELEIFKHNKAVQLDNEKDNFSNRFAQNLDRQRHALSTNYQQQTDALDNLDSNARLDKLEMLETNRNIMQAITEAHSDKYYQTKDTNVKEINHLRDEHIDNYYNTKSANEKEIVNLSRLHGSRYKNTQDTQQAEFQKLVKNHQVQKVETNKSFEKEYNNILSQNNIKLESLDERTKGIVQKLKEKFLQNANLVLDKSKDPFYQFKRLEPSIEDKGKHYDVSIEIPEHEKNLVQISGKNRNLKLTFNRLHEEVFNDVENVKNIAKKRES